MHTLPPPGTPFPAQKDGIPFGVGPTVLLPGGPYSGRGRSGEEAGGAAPTPQWPPAMPSLHAASCSACSTPRATAPPRGPWGLPLLPVQTSPRSQWARWAGT